MSITIDILRKRIGDCQDCRLHRTRRNIVIGRGRLPAKVLLLGEGPGIAEDLTGESFSGPSGALLDRMILDARTINGEEIEEPSIFIANIVLCHPTDTFAGDNRQPIRDEVLACVENIRLICKSVLPEMVVFLGDEAEYYYKKEFPNSVKIYHPSYLLKTGGLESRNYLHSIRVLAEVFQEVNKNGGWFEEDLQTKGA